MNPRCPLSFTLFVFGATTWIGCTPQSAPTGDTARGATLFAVADGVGPGCQACHCADATGGCLMNAPNIQGKPYETIDARTRGSVSHPGGKFNLTDQDIADIEAFLASLEP